LPSLSSKKLTVLSPPIPPYSNLPIQANFYEPSQFFISAISLGYPTVVTTTVNNNYVIGQLCRLVIPQSFGCRQLNEALGYVLTQPSANQVGLSINSSQNVDPFIASSATTQPQILPVGDVNSGVTNASGRMNNATAIPGSFQNISPPAG
jgi:hypothetical protein